MWFLGFQALVEQVDATRDVFSLFVCDVETDGGFVFVEKESTFAERTGMTAASAKKNSRHTMNQSAILICVSKTIRYK